MRVGNYIGDEADDSGGKPLAYEKKGLLLMHMHLAIESCCARARTWGRPAFQILYMRWPAFQILYVGSASFSNPVRGVASFSNPVYGVGQLFQILDMGWPAFSNPVHGVG